MRKTLIIAAGTVLAIIILIFGNMPPGPQIASTDAAANAPAYENPIRVSDLEGLAAGGYINVVVKRIVDGDTIWVEYNGE